MPSFIKNSIKCTPLKVEGAKPEHEKLEKICDLIKNRRYQSDSFPNAGWAAFPFLTYEELTKEISTLDLPNDLSVLPAIGVVDVVNADLKKNVPPKIYQELPLKNKYKQIYMDFIFYVKNNKTFVLISSSNKKSAEISTKQFLNNNPFTDYNFIFHETPEEFRVSGDLILWLLYCYYMKDKIITNDMKIMDFLFLTGMSGTPNSFEYEGRATPTYLEEVKFSIVKNRVFDKLLMTLKFKNDIFEFKLFDDGRVEFNVAECEYLENSDDLKKKLGILTYIYTDIIPEIKKAYNTNLKVWNDTEREAFRKEMSKGLKDII